MSDIDWKARAEAAEKRVAQWEHDIKFWGIAEIAVRNVSVMDYMKHWEGRAEAAEQACQDHMNAIAYTTAQFANVARRAEAAEKERDRLREELTKIACMANMNHDGNHLQKIARTALEANKLLARAEAAEKELAVVIGARSQC
jgi:uncharacterized protein involved in type VI secretion and phage assembly